MTPVVMGLSQRHLDAIIRAARVGNVTPLMLISQIVIEWVARWEGEESLARGDEPMVPRSELPHATHR